MSTVTFSLGSASSDSQVHDIGCSTAPRIVKLHASSGVCGVGPADSTGKSSVTYWPGGTRARSAPSVPLDGEATNEGEGRVGDLLPAAVDRQCVSAARKHEELRHALI